MSLKIKAGRTLKLIPSLIASLSNVLLSVSGSLVEVVVEWLTSYTLLTHDDIQELIRKGYITADSLRVNATSVDVTLDDLIEFEATQRNIGKIDLGEKEVPKMLRASIGGGYELGPNEFILAATVEEFNLPDNITAIYYLKSSLARCGLNHSLAGFIDPGFNGSKLTLELTNLLKFNTLVLKAGMPIGQIKFFRHKLVPKDKSYRVTGQYNGDKSVQGSKGVRDGSQQE